MGLLDFPLREPLYSRLRASASCLLYHRTSGNFTFNS